MRRDFAREQTICTGCLVSMMIYERREIEKNNSDGNEDLRKFKKGILKMQNNVK